MKLNHLHFASPDAERTRAFYETYFGFRLRRRLGATLVLGGNDGFLLAIDDAADRAAPSAALHFGFCLESEARVAEVFERMRADAVPVLRPLRRLSENAVQFYCQDPTGNEVEVGWYRTL